MAKWLSHCRASVALAALTCALLGSAVTALAWVGGESGAYLRAPVGAASVAMGGAGSASPDYLGAWWNPAVLPMYDSRHVSAGLGVRSLGRMEGNADLSLRIPTRFGIGVSALYRGDPFLDDLRDEYGEKLDGGSYTTLSLRAGVGVRISRSWSAGVSLGLFYQSLPTDYTGAGTLVRSNVTGIGGFTLAARYEKSERLGLALLVKNLGLDMDWSLNAEEQGFEYSYAQVKDSPLPEFVLASRFQTTLLGRPFVWASDLSGWVVDGDLHVLDHPQGVWNNGVEWQFWDTFCFRLGIGEVPLEGSFVNDSKQYWEAFTMRVSGGFGWELRKLREGLQVHYAISSDKVGSLFDQALDITLTF